MVTAPPIMANTNPSNIFQNINSTGNAPGPGENAPFGINTAGGFSAPVDQNFNSPVWYPQPNLIGNAANLGGSAISNFYFANPQAFYGQNTPAVYSAINQGFLNAGQQAPSINPIHLGNTAQYGGASLSSPMSFTGANLNTRSDQGYQVAQNKQINQLNALANGTGPSVAAMQATNTAQQNVQNQMAMLASARGASNPAVAQRAAQEFAAQQGQSAVQTAATARVQEQLAAQQQLASALGGARGQAQSTAGTQAGFQQAAGLANAGAYNTAATNQAQLLQQAGLANAGALNTANLQQGGINQALGIANLQAATAGNQLNAQQYNAMLQAMTNQNQTDVSNNAAFQQLLSNQELGIAQINTGHQIANENNQYGLAGAGVGALGALAMLAA